MVSDMSMLSQETILNSMGDAKIKRKLVATDTKNEEKEDASVVQRRSQLLAAEYVLSAYIHGEPFARLEDFRQEFFVKPLHRSVYEYLTGLKARGQSLKIGYIFDLTEESQADADALLAAAEKIPKAGAEAHYRQCLKTLFQETLEKYKADLIEKLKTTEDGKDKELLKKEMRKQLGEKKK
jgi:hypothetical protein